MGVRIKDIADAANVSTATVSLVLNNKPGISESTRKKVLLVQRGLNRDLKKKKSFSETRIGTIRFLKIFRHGHVLSQDHDAFVLRYIEGAEKEARLNGFNLDINSVYLDEMADVLKLIEESSANGLVVLATELSDKDMFFFEGLNIPVVYIDAILNHRRFDFVDMNNTAAVHLIIKYFIDHGHKKIGLIESPVEAKNLELRSLEYPKALERYGIPFNKDYVYSVDSTFDGAYKDMVKILRKKPSLPTAIFSTNDIMAYASIKALKEFGIRVPEDISIIGFDDLPICTIMEPPLTTMHVSQSQIGKMAVRLIINRIDETLTAPSIQISIGGEIVERKSVRHIDI